MAIFGFRLSNDQAVAFDINAVWAHIEGLKAAPEPFERPDLIAIKAQCEPDPAIPEIIVKRRKVRFLGVSLVILVSCLTTVLFPATVAIPAIIGALIVCAKLWTRGGGYAKSFIDEYSSALNAYQGREQAFDKSSELPVAFTELKRRLEQEKVEYLAIPALKKKRRAELEAKRIVKQKQRHLERFRLENERIQNIGEKTKMILYTWGILDAADVEPHRISQIKGFGPVRQQALLSWRASKEVLFRFNPNEPVDPSDLRALEQDFAQKASAIRSKLIAGPASLRLPLSVWHSQRRQLLESLGVAAKRLVVAQVNLEALRKF